MLVLGGRAGRESNAHGALTGGKVAEMRIADILREEQEDGPCCGHRATAASPSNNNNGGGARRRTKTTSFPSPRCLLSKWLPSKQFLQCRRCGEEYNDEELAEEQDGEESGAGSCVSSLGLTAEGGPRVAVDRVQEGSSNLEAMASSGEGAVAPVVSEGRTTVGSVWKPEQTSLNVGMGAGLLFLLTSSITEFNKMIELRKELEVLLKEIKGAMKRKDVSLNSGESKNNLSFCSSDSWADTEQSNDLPQQSCNPWLELVETTCHPELDSHGKYWKACEDIMSPRINKMEAELESELELLQLNVDKQDSSEQLRVELSGERTDPSESFSVSLGEHYEPKQLVEEEEDNDSRDQYGVCPQELTRRLHELLESRQQERIAELESALEIAHIKLREKEMEVCWWRDASQLVSQNKQETLFG